MLAGCEFVQAVKSDYTYYTQNAHGDVVNLTDNNGAVTKTYQYDAFGVEKNIDDTDTMHFGIVASIMIRKLLPFICVRDTIVLPMDGLSRETLLLAAIMIR